MRLANPPPIAAADQGTAGAALAEAGEEANTVAGLTRADPPAGQLAQGNASNASAISSGAESASDSDAGERNASDAPPSRAARGCEKAQMELSNPPPIKSGPEAAVMAGPCDAAAVA